MAGGLIKDCCESLETPGAVVEGRDLHHDSGIESLS